jgi:hypothetical protein
MLIIRHFEGAKRVEEFLPLTSKISFEMTWKMALFPVTCPNAQVIFA